MCVLAAKEDWLPYCIDFCAVEFICELYSTKIYVSAITNKNEKVVWLCETMCTAIYIM